MRISDWSSDVCSSDLRATHARLLVDHCIHGDLMDTMISRQAFGLLWLNPPYGDLARDTSGNLGYEGKGRARLEKLFYQRMLPLLQYGGILVFRSEEHTSELQSLMRISYAVFCLKKKKIKQKNIQ